MLSAPSKPWRCSRLHRLKKRLICTHGSRCSALLYARPPFSAQVYEVEIIYSSKRSSHLPHVQSALFSLPYPQKLSWVSCMWWLQYFSDTVDWNLWDISKPHIRTAAPIFSVEKLVQENCARLLQLWSVKKLSGLLRCDYKHKRSHLCLLYSARRLWNSWSLSFLLRSFEISIRPIHIPLFKSLITSYILFVFARKLWQQLCKVHSLPLPFIKSRALLETSLPCTYVGSSLICLTYHPFPRNDLVLTLFKSLAELEHDFLSSCREQPYQDTAQHRLMCFKPAIIQEQISICKDSCSDRSCVYRDYKNIMKTKLLNPCFSPF